VDYASAVSILNASEVTMPTTVSPRGRTIIPVEIRRHFRIGAGDRLEWIIEGDQIQVVPLHADPIEAFRARGQGGATRRLLADRLADSEPANNLASSAAAN
jgi:AbrB family looped-hinge helix DNA binding protein